MSSANTKTEIAVGAFVMLGLAALAYLSISIGGLQLIAPDRYGIKARFASVGDLKEGAPVRLAGVKIGQVTDVKLVDYLAEAELAVARSIELPKDTVASIRSEGLLGDTYVALSPGGSLEDLREGSLITRTEPAIDLGDLLARYAFGQGSADKTSPESGAEQDDLFSDPKP